MDFDFLERGTAWAATKIAGTRRDQWELPTPCDAWDVHALIVHMIAGAHHYATIGRGSHVAGSRGRDLAIDFGDDPVGAYEASRDDILASFGAPGALERIVPGNVGEWPGAVHASVLFIDHLIHGWDLSIATGQDATMPPDLAESAWRIVNDDIPQPVIEAFDAFRDPDGANAMFKPKVATDESASAQDKLVAYFGHQATTVRQ